MASKHRGAGNTNRINLPIELSSDDEEENLSEAAKRKPTLYSLTVEDLASISTREKYVRGPCIQALIEILHMRGTDFYTHMINKRYDDAKNLLHPDERYDEGPNSVWKTPEKREVTVKSRILLIPCHILGKTREDDDHWALAARIKIRDGGYKLYVIDSLGQKNGNKIMKTLLQPLKKIGLITKKETCEVLDTCLQTEGECGIRTMTYMMQFKKWAIRDVETTGVIKRMKNFIVREKKDRKNLAHRYRSRIHQAVQEEKTIDKRVSMRSIRT